MLHFLVLFFSFFKNIIRKFNCESNWILTWVNCYMPNVYNNISCSTNYQKWDSRRAPGLKSLSRKWWTGWRVKAVSSQHSLRPLIQWRAPASWKSHCLITESWMVHKYLGQMPMLMNEVSDWETFFVKLCQWPLWVSLLLWLKQG